MRILLTNDDGIEADGLHAVREELLKVPGVELMIIAPDGNRSATGRMITTRRPIVSRQVTFEDGGVGWAIDGSPVDCVRLGWYELGGAKPDLIVAGINHGANLGDDTTYSGTVGAALEAHHLGLPGLALSQVARGAGLSFTDEGGYDFRVLARFAADLVRDAEQVGLVAGTVLNVNAPAGDVAGVRLTRLGKRVYQDGLRRLEGEAPERAARHNAAEPVVTYGNAERVVVYGVAAGHLDEDGTDLHAVANGLISVTPVSLRWTDDSRLADLPDAAFAAALSAQPDEPMTLSPAELEADAVGVDADRGPGPKARPGADPGADATSLTAGGDAR